MLDGLKNTLRKIFHLKAKPPEPEVPKEIVDNKHVRNAIIKKYRRKIGKIVLGTAFASAALSTGLQFTPNAVSTKYDDFMASKGYADNYSQNFQTKEIRVYDRFNPLYPFHLAGRVVNMTWHESLKERHIGLIPLALETPFLYKNVLWKGFKDMIPTSELDAYSIANNDKVTERVNFIRPPGEFSLNSFLRDFSMVDGRKLEFASDKQELRDVLYQFVMLHEARHGDQEKLAFMTANESDADLYAFKVLASRGTDPKLLNEAATIVAHARAINATLRGDQGHITTFTLERNGQRIFDAYEDAAAFDRLSAILQEADHRNDANFPAKMPAGTRYFYLTMAMHKEGLLNEDPGMKTAAAAYIDAILYFDGLSGHKMIDQKFDVGKIDLSYLTQQYKPVPDKLNVRNPPAPKPGA